MPATHDAFCGQGDLTGSACIVILFGSGLAVGSHLDAALYWRMALCPCEGARKD